MSTGSSGYTGYDPPLPPPRSVHRPATPLSSTMAIWALGLSLIPGLLSQVVAVVLAIITLNRVQDGRAAGRVWPSPRW